MKQTVACIILLVIMCSQIRLFADSPVLVIDPHGHSGMIQDIMFSPDGKTLISVSLDKTIRLWDVKTGDLLRTLRIPIGEGTQGMIHAGALSSDGKMMAVGGWPYEDENVGIPVYLLDLEQGEIIGLLDGHDDVIVALDFSRDGKWLVSGGDTTVILWNLSTHKLAISLGGHKDGVTDVAISSDGYTITSAAFDGTFRIWELSKDHHSIKKTKKSKKHTSSIESIAYAPNGKYIATAGDDYRILLWNTKGKVVKKMTATSYPGTIAFSDDSQKLLLAGTQEAPAVVYQVPSGKELTTFSKHTNIVLASAFYGNDRVATAGGNNKDIYIWDADTGEVQTHIVGKGQTVWSVAFGNGLSVAFGNTNTSGGEVNPGAKDFTQFADYPVYTPLDHSFDFATMSLNRQSPKESDFERSQTTYQNKKLKRVSWEKLKVTGEGQIFNDRFGARWIRAYTFTEQGNVIAGFESWIRSFQQDGTLLWEQSGHTGEPWAFAVSHDGRILASASDDQTIKLWNTESGECLATLFVTRDNEWICWTPQGYYAASAGGEKYIGWHLNQDPDKIASFHPVSVFRKRFHNPEIVKLTIAQGSFEQAMKVFNTKAREPIKKAQITDALPPTIQWELPKNLRTTQTETSLRIKANILMTDDIKDLRILVNGRVLMSDRGLSVVKGEQKTTLDRVIKLTPGENEIRIFVENRYAGITSEPRIVVVEKGDDWLKPNAYMIAVGISKYKEQGFDLEYADDDARAMSALFRSQQGLLYKTVNIRELYDTDATRDNILDALEWIEKETTQNDIAVIFMAAHGINDNRGRFYVLPSDGDSNSLRRTAVGLSEFIDILGNLPSRVLFFLDTCHSGQLGENLFRMRGRVDNTEAIRELASDENGIIILAASTGQEYSLEHPDWGHGAFTKALLDGLQKGKADYSKDGIIHLRELDTYIADRVKELTGGRQHPTTLKPSTISRLPIIQIGK